MADNKKRIYTIQINGIDQSIKQVDALSDSLQFLDKRIKELETRSVSITSSSNGGGGGSSSRTSELQTEDKLLKQIQATEQQIRDARREDYQNLLAEKDILKEEKELQEQRAAAERMAASNYSNTMKGLKQELSDIKKVMQTTELGSTEFDDLTKRAGDLTNKLKSLEQEYGQYGRNVDNYANSIAEGLENAVKTSTSISIEVNGVTREFNDAREASRQLGYELKSMAVNGQQNTKEFKELQKAVAQLNSDIKDATVSSVAMDNMLDTLKGLSAIASTTEGLSALFGFDNDEIERSIQKLVALQNVMQGIEEIRQQMNTGEGVGGWLAKGNDAIDKFVEKLLGAKKAQEGLNAAEEAGETATNGLATAQEAQAVATNKATLSTKLLSLALKSIGIGLVVAAVAYLVENWDDLKDTFEDTVPALKNLSKWFDKIKAVVMGVGSVIVNYLVQPLATLIQTIANIINGESLSKIFGDIKTGLKNTFNVVGNFQKGYNKETERQQISHNRKMLENQKKANDEWLKDEEAKYGKSNKRTQEYLKKQLDLVNKQIATTKKGSKQYDELVEQQKDLQRQLWESEREASDERKKKGEKLAKELQKKALDAEKELNRLKINAMKDGLRKTITQLEEERKQKIAKIKADGVMVKELTEQVELEYNKKIEDARKEHVKEVVKIEKSMYDELIAQRIAYNKSIKELYEISDENSVNRLNKGTNKLFNQSIASYGIQGKDRYSKSTQASLGIVSNQKSEIVEDYKRLIEIMREYSLAENAYKNASLKSLNEIEDAHKKLLKTEEETKEKLKKLEWDGVFMQEDEYNKKKYNIEKVLDIERQKFNKLKEQSDAEVRLTLATSKEKEKIYNEYYASLQKKYYSQDDQKKTKETFNSLLYENYAKSNSLIFNQRLSAVEAYWKARLYNTKINAEAEYELEKKLLNDEKEQEKRALDASISEQITKQEEWFDKKRELIDTDYENGKLTDEEYYNQLVKLNTDYKTASLDSEKIFKEQKGIIEKKYEQKEIQLENEKNNKLRQVNAEYYQDALQEFRDFQTALNSLEKRQSVKNAFGVVNLKATNKNNRELLESYEELAKQVGEKRKKITEEFQNGLIDRSVYESSMREMDTFVEGLGDKMDEVKHKLSFAGGWEQLSEGLNNWMQEIGQAVNTILSSISEIQSNEFDKMIEDQEEYIDEYSDLLDKQKDKTQEYADAVKNIEDELSTARGARRQELIDQLNAEMATQRASLAQEKKIEKEKEKAEERKKTLEHDQAVAKKKMQEAQAYINMAMAISMAAVNSWPIPAIPMMALAAATSAAQIAAIKSQNIPSYGSGGVIEGKSHAQGGVKAVVGNSPIELEGNEFIIRKKSTIPNLNLLDFVNRSEKKLSLDDLINFYTNGNGMRKRVVSNSPKSRYADGGMIPTLRNDINLSDRLLTAFEDYSNRPQVVSVVEIVDKMQTVKEVQTMAGLID